MTITKGSAVEVNSDVPGFNGAWYAATIIDEVKASPAKNRKDKKIGYLVEYDTLFEDEPLTEVVDPSFVRPSPPPPPPRVVEDFEVYDVVDAYHRDGWWIGVVKTVIDEGEIWKYVVSFQNPNDEFQFQKSELRLHVDWVDCRWTPEQESGDRNATRDARSGFTTPSKGARNEAAGPASSAKKNSQTRKRSECTAVDSSVTRRKAFQSSASSKGKTKVIVPVLETSRSDEINQDSPPIEHAIIITQTRDGTSHQKRKRERRPKLVVNKPIDLLQVIPITPPQKPHFSPLKEKKADYREGLAIAHMVTFGNLVQNLSGLQPNDPVDIINSSLETLHDLETHGFDVGPIRGRLTKLLSLKSTACEHEDTRKEVEKEIEKCNSVVEKEMDELEVKMKVLKEKSAQTASMMKVKDDEMMRLKSSLHLVSIQISDLKLAFEELAATPL
ncbi:hypothetical protein L1987_21686 [Smallanthus sonchifolius]|uniref:Uncharacterized protein n=1 Tax=Smallanthus sonchifolius TaxID=185202 RepID=A0ACB9ICS7_9ASTR|nr:hypothetical protein L1987_21686 [Smallanthus sonchifolius]